jgi:hypothetical protein
MCDQHWYLTMNCRACRTHEVATLYLLAAQEPLVFYSAACSF